MNNRQWFLLCRGGAKTKVSLRKTLAEGCIIIYNVIMFSRTDRGIIIYNVQWHR